MSLGPIPWSSIERYAARYGLSNEDLETLEFHIRKMEEALDAHHAQKNPNEKGR